MPLLLIGLRVNSIRIQIIIFKMESLL